MSLQQTHKHGRACVKCQTCGATFIGKGAIQRWSEHTWVHYEWNAKTPAQPEG